jgi:hypothetical protein
MRRIVVAVVLAAGPLCVVPAAAADRPKKPQPASVQAEEKRFEECRAKLKLAAELKMLHDFGWDPPREPHVVVGPTFFDVPIDAKQGLAETINCFLVSGKRGEDVPFDLLHWQTGKPVGRFSRGTLRML